MFRPRRLPWLVVLALAIGQVAQPALARSLVIGTIGDQPSSEIRTFSPFAGYLGTALAAAGIDEAKVVVAGTIGQMVGYLRTGKVDVYVDSPLVALAVNHASGSRMLVRRWKRGVAAYRSVVFVRDDGGVASPADLIGRVIAFEEPFSSSGYILPKIHFLEQGLRMEPLVNRADPVGQDRIGFVFSGDDENTMVWVLRGRVAAGAMSEANFEKQAKASIGELRVIHRTIAIPRHVVSVGPGVPANLARSLSNVLTTMDRNEDGRRALEAFERTIKFDAIPTDVQRNLLDILDRVLTLLDVD